MIVVEWVIILPALLLVVFLAVQYGMWANYKDIAVAAAQDAATDFASQGVPSVDAGRAVVEQYLADYGGGPLDEVVVSVTTSSVNGQSDTVTVTITAAAPAVLDAAHLPVRARATVPLERFRP